MKSASVNFTAGHNVPLFQAHRVMTNDPNVINGLVPPPQGIQAIMNHQAGRVPELGPVSGRSSGRAPAQRLITSPRGNGYILAGKPKTETMR